VLEHAQFPIKGRASGSGSSGSHGSDSAATTGEYATLSQALGLLDGLGTKTMSEQEFLSTCLAAKPLDIREARGYAW
jgi:hypothetical protein